MSLDDAQKQTVSNWIEEGLELSEIQGRLSSELGVSMTYMETRFLVDDLGLQIKDKEPEPEPEPEPQPEEPATQPVEQAQEEAPSPEATPAPGDQPAAGGGKVTIELDKITPPGAVVAGKVTFSDGKGAAWSLDQMGRLGLQTDEEGYKPSEEDVMEFQMELQAILQRGGV